MNSPVFIAKIADQLGCQPERVDRILTAVMQALRDGLNDQEAATIESSLPAAMRSLWPKTAGTHPGLADLGDIGFLGRVRELSESPSDHENRLSVLVVMNVLMTEIWNPAKTSTAAWTALSHLPREKKAIWMKLFRAACFPVETLVQRPLKEGRRFSKNARTPS